MSAKWSVNAETQHVGTFNPAHGVRHEWTTNVSRETCIKDSSYWLDSLLLNWSRWMRSDSGPDGLPAKACGGFMGYAGLVTDSEDAYEKLDVELAIKVNAAIEDLEPAEQMAVYVKYGVAAVARFRNSTVLETALSKLESSFQRRGIWMGA